jgi:hypothetical protein
VWVSSVTDTRGGCGRELACGVKVDAALWRRRPIMMIAGAMPQIKH